MPVPCVRAGEDTEGDAFVVGDTAAESIGKSSCLVLTNCCATLNTSNDFDRGGALRRGLDFARSNLGDRGRALSDVAAFFVNSSQVSSAFCLPSFKISTGNESDLDRDGALRPTSEAD